MSGAALRADHSGSPHCCSPCNCCTTCDSWNRWPMRCDAWKNLPTHKLTHSV